MYKTLLTLRDTFNCNTSIVALSWITSTPSVISCTFLCVQSDTVALPELFFTGLSNLYLLLLRLEILFALCHPLFALCHLLFRSPITDRLSLISWTVRVCNDQSQKSECNPSLRVLRKSSFVRLSWFRTNQKRLGVKPNLIGQNLVEPVI